MIERIPSISSLLARARMATPRFVVASVMVATFVASQWMALDHSLVHHAGAHGDCLSACLDAESDSSSTNLRVARAIAEQHHCEADCSPSNADNGAEPKPSRPGEPCDHGDDCPLLVFAQASFSSETVSVELPVEKLPASPEFAAPAAPVASGRTPLSFAPKTSPPLFRAV